MSRLQNLFAAGLLCAVAALGQSTALEHFIVKAAKPYDKAIAAIEARGGRVTHQFKYVDALAVQAPAAAIAAIRATDGVISLRKDPIVQAAPSRSDPDLQALGRGTFVQLRPDSVNALSEGDMRALASGSTTAGYNVENTLMGLGPLFDSGKHGEGVLVAVIDSGLRPSFPHIRGSVIGGEDLVGDGHGYSDDANDGHGTFVTGMIAAHVGFLFPSTSLLVTALNSYAPGAARPYNATQSLVPMVGTAPAASIYMLRTTDGPTPNSRIMAAMERVIQLREMYDAGLPGGLNIKVCNMSIGGPVLDPGTDPEDQLIDAMLAHDIVPVVAAGNSGPAPLTVGTPATSKGALTVGGSSFAHNERVYGELNLGAGFGALYRPFAGALMYFFSSRGPAANGEVLPHVVANGHFNFGMGTGPIGYVGFESGTSGAAPSVAGIAAVLRQAYPNATARQIRNAIILSANPNFVNFVDKLDQGHGFVNATAAANLLATGSVPDSLNPLPNANPSVQVNLEQNSSVRVRDGLVRQTFHLRPGERGEIVYKVNPNTSQVIVSVSNFVAVPPAQQNQVLGDVLSFGIHPAQTTDFASEGDYVSPLERMRTGTRIVNNPEPGLMRISVNGNMHNAEDVSADVTVVSLTDPIPQFTSQGKITAAQTVLLPFTIAAGTRQANFRLAWNADWGTFPAADIDLYLISPTGRINNQGATEDNPESVFILNPEAGAWLAMITGFDIPAGSDKYEFRVELDGKVIH